MHMTRRAPELSATSGLDCIWIMDSNLPELVGGALGGLRQHFPGLRLRLRRALDDAGDLARLEGIALVVSVVLFRPTHGLLQNRVQEGPLDLDHNGLVALVGDDQPFENSLRHLGFPTPPTSRAARS